MFLQKIFKTSLIASFLVCMSSSLLADLVVTINQVDPLNACAVAGGTITYAINVFNSGPTSVRGIVFDDTVTSLANTAGICLSSVSGAECLDFCVEPRSNGFHATTRETLEAGQSFSFTATYRICTAPQDTLANTVIVTAKDCRGNLLDTTQTLQSCVNGCALEVLVTPAVITQVCDNSSITFHAQVAGSCESPSSLTYMWTDQGGNPLTATEPGVLTLSAQQIVPLGTITSVIVTVTDNFTGCSVTGQSGPLSVGGCADLSITKTATVAYGVVTYHITVTNNGPDVGTIKVIDCLPACLTPLQINVGVDIPQWTYFVNNNCVVATYNSELLPGQSASFDIVAQIDKHACGKSICNTATVQGNIFDPNLSNNSATVKIKTKKRK